MNPQDRNNILTVVFNEITAEGGYFLGFTYDAMAQTGTCNCANTGFLRIPGFKVTHKDNATVLVFRTHHQDRKKVTIPVSSHNEFKLNAKTQIKAQLQPYAGDWNDSATNPFHPDYKEQSDDWNYDLGPKPPEEG